MSEREGLKMYEKQRVKVRGHLDDKKDWQESYREVGRVCIKLPEIDGKIVAPYVWVINITAWGEGVHERIGEQVEFDAVVSRFTDRNNHVDYSLRNPSPPKWLKDAVTSNRIPDPPNMAKLAPNGIPVRTVPLKPKQPKEATVERNGKHEKKSRSVNKLSNVQFYELVEAVKTHRERIDGKMTFVEAFTELGSGLNFPISKDAVKTALEMVGVKTVAKQRSDVGKLRKGNAISTLVRAVVEIAAESGVTFSEGLADELEALAVKCEAAPERG